MEGEELFEGTKALYPAGYSIKNCLPEFSG